MSDVSKTNELIVAKLRKAAKQAEWYQALDPKLLTAAADALEAATEGDYHEGLEEGIKIGRAERDAALGALERVRALHPKHEVLICGAMSEVPHRHGSEREPYPIRPVTCTKLQGHEGSHRDASCCWNFQRFDTHAAYKSAEWADRSICSHCQTAWPCLTVAALDGAPEPEWEYGMQDDYGLSFLRNIAEAYDHANRQDPELNPRPVRRRKAGPWLPVEGESK